MKLITHLVGLLIVELVVHSVTADISLHLKNQQYLPSGQDSQISSDQQKFEESKYGNAKYFHFEVHDQLDSNNGRGLPREPSGNNNKNNLNSPSSTKEIRIEHINAPPGFPLDNPDLDASLLNVASEEGNNQIVLKHENVQTSSPPSINIPVPFPSNYQHDFPEKSSENFLDYEAPQQDLKSSRPRQESAQIDSFQSSKYVPPLNNPQAENQQYSQQVIENGFKESVFLPPPESHNHHLTQYKGPGYLPPYGISDPQTIPFKASQYLPPDNGNNPFKGPDYLPPQQSTGGQQRLEGVNSNNHFKAPDYLPPPQIGYNQESFQRSNPFKGADYLPPSNSNGAGQQGSYQPNNPFKGTGYLPPHLQQQQQQQSLLQYPINDAGVKAPGYLPPGYDFQKPSNSEDAIAELHTLPEQTTNNQNQHQQTQVPLQSHTQEAGSQVPSDIVNGTPKHGNGPQASDPSSHQASAYLPPDYENSENGGHQVQTTSSPGYIPPPTQSGREMRTYSPPGYLPPGYDFQKPLETEQGQGPNYQESGGQKQQSLPQSQAQNHHGQTQNFDQKSVQPAYAKGPGYLPPSPHALTNAFKGPGYLPPFSNSPDQPAQQLSQAYNSPGFLPPTGYSHHQSAQQSGQVFKGPDYLPPTGSIQTFQGPGYLPPTAHIFSNHGFKGSDYLPPYIISRQPIYQQSNFKASGYLPPKAPPAPFSTYMHPLSSYMTNVQPFERYGSTRKPFPDYGPPPTQFVPINDVAPMYKEAANRPQYYAPAMSYTTNAVSSQTYNSRPEPHVTQSTPLSQQAREALQTFMPEEIRQGNPSFREGGNTVSSSSSAAIPKKPTPTPVSAKIRTVQIVNPNAVKTLKVLESLDHAGVKTIQILGPSNETPMGEHRVVRVVSGHEQTVQTVKIYNDQQDYTPSASIASKTAPAQSSANSDYLPPRHKRNPKKLSGKGHQRVTGN